VDAWLAEHGDLIPARLVETPRVSPAPVAPSYETIVLAALPRGSRVHRVDSFDEEVPLARLLIVPPALRTPAALRFEDLVPEAEALERAMAAVEERTRRDGWRVVLQPPLYQGVSVDTVLRLDEHVSSPEVIDRARQTLATRLSPTVGGADGTGWPFGKSVDAREVAAWLAGVQGVAAAEEVRLFAVNPITLQIAPEPAARIELQPDELVFLTAPRIVSTRDLPA
jgi:hypothetical protein